MTVPNPEVDAIMAANPGMSRQAARNELKAIRKFKLRSYTTNAEGDITSEKFVAPGVENPAEIPGPRYISRTSTLYGAEGEVTQQWVIEKPEDRRFNDFIAGVFERIDNDCPSRAIIPSPVGLLAPDLCVGYPIGDHHVGMLSWKHETGESYDIDIAAEMLNGAMEYLVSAAPPAEQAIVAVLGDFFHYDSFDQVTPEHRNLLDSDGRAPKMIGAGWDLIESAIELAAQRHDRVHVIVELGNHDGYTAMVTARFLHRLYRDNPRITIDRGSGHFHYFEWGKTLIGTHHGHGRAAKPADLGGVMAADRAEAWGRTKFRYWWTGHIHKQTVYDLPGCRVESFRILPPADAYAHNEGYRSGRDMNAITLHKEFGETGRSTVNPLMLRRA